MLSKSESIADLAAALAKAQGEFPAIAKGKTANVKGKSKDGAPVEYSYAYADLADILEAVRKPLSAHGLSLIQPIVTPGDDSVLVTVLLHASGQWIESTFPVEMFDKPQETGSALTYARRYAATSLLGIAAEEDDDGAAAQSGEKRRSTSASKRPACSKCGHNRSVIEGKDEYGGGWLCFAKKGGCGATWYDEQRPAPKAKESRPDLPPPSETLTCRFCASVDVVDDGRGNFVCNACARGWAK